MQTTCWLSQLFHAIAWPWQECLSIFIEGDSARLLNCSVEKNQEKTYRTFHCLSMSWNHLSPQWARAFGLRLQGRSESQETSARRKAWAASFLLAKHSQNKNWGFHMFSSIIMTCQTKSCLRSTVNTVALLQEANKTSAKEDRSGGLKIESSAWEMRVLDLFYLVLQCLVVLQLWNHSLKGLNYCPTASVLWFSGKYRHSWFPAKWRCGGFHRLHCTSFCVKPLWGTHVYSRKRADRTRWCCSHLLVPLLQASLSLKTSQVRTKGSSESFFKAQRHGRG